MSIVLRKAAEQDAFLIAQTRKQVWQETYRGIFPDEMLDDYDMESFAQRDRKKIASSEHHYCLFLDGETCAGYFSFGPYNFGSYKDFVLCLNNLYICSGYQGRGLGKQAFAYIREYCRMNGIPKFFCGCNLHNLPAQEFYRRMGGITGDLSGGHENRSDDIIHFEFHIGE